MGIKECSYRKRNNLQKDITHSKKGQLTVVIIVGVVLIIIVAVFLIYRQERQQYQTLFQIWKKQKQLLLTLQVFQEQLKY